MNNFTRYVNPHLGKMLTHIKLDQTYVRGEDCYLFDAAGNRYLDCIAAYGALPFGHNPTVIWDAINRFRVSCEPSFIQPSALAAAGELARCLLEFAPAGLEYVTFSNSGTEAVEAAIKLCRSAAGRLGILATKNSFHGKTFGALSATGNPNYQKAFGAPAEFFHHIAFGDIAALEEELARRPGYYAAFIVETIQGEGGIVLPPTGYLAAAKEICTHHKVLLVLDEVQAGMGRTGTLFACEQENVTPDVLVLAKALGGGIMPIGACLCSDEAYSEDFALKHSSTFAGNSLACRVGLQVMEVLTRDQGALLEEVRGKGELLKTGLLELQKQYPHLIKAVRGRGLMLGLEFNVDRDVFPGSMLGVMAEQELLTPAISSYLLNVEKVRVAPTLNGSAVIRIEPPLTISRSQCRDALDGIAAMLGCLNENNTARFLSYLVRTDNGESYPPFIPYFPNRSTPSVDPEEGRFAFLIHALDLASYHQFDNSLCAFSEKELSDLIGRVGDLVGPFVVSRACINSANGSKAYGEFIALPRTTDEFMEMPRQQALAELKAAVALARDRGARIIGLGAYTAVVSMGGLHLKDEGVPITTGNSYTVVSAVDAVNTATEQLEIDRSTIIAAVVGAAGSIGKGISLLLSETVPRLILIGNPNNKTSSERLYSMAAEIYRYQAALLQQGRPLKAGSMGRLLAGCAALPLPDAPLEAFKAFADGEGRKLGLIEFSTNIDAVLSRADVVISATSTTGKMIHAGNLKQGAIVCDISRPANVSEEVDQARPDVLVIDGGVVKVPGLPSLGWDFGFEPGLAYACMAETMMLALEQRYQNYSLGSSGVNLETILQMRYLAAEHGFKLAAFRSFNRPLSEESWQQLLQARRSFAIR
ncbi:MAG TPA: aminotransferase class III-fold pyridoxal phosphate-dependent enzyme [Candidatus Limnocylindrales bacterium]|nr:aminotransferase class III-fold pyridoxal phosphate-dependent enzyme [Candidatus Limnocylindrales bacterium]